MTGKGLVLVAVLAAGASVWAQGTVAVTPSVWVAPPESVGCPIRVDAQRRSLTDLSWAGEGDRPKAGGQGLHLDFGRSDADFDRRDTPRIVKADVVVHGTSSASRVMPAGSGARNDVAETFELVRPAAALTLARADVWTKKMMSIGWVEVVGLEYADGTSWRASKGSVCRAAPNGLLLVAQGH